MCFWIMRRPAVTDRTRLTRRGVLAGATLAGVAGIVGTRLGTANAAPVGTLAPAATSNLALTSSNSQLVADFAWAKQRALDWVQTGKKAGYIPCYWAGLTTRPAFYSRDFAHQATGAHLLGLDTENLSM